LSFIVGVVVLSVLSPLAGVMYRADDQEERLKLPLTNTSAFDVGV
jgi:hypothetical protein